MTIEEFFTLIWGQGTGLLVLKTNQGWKHYKLSSHEVAAAAVKRLEDKGDVYHSCGLFDGEPRTQGNVKSLRTFWLDIDCGEAKGYPTQADALSALGQFVDELGLPSPYIINSGAGLHVYWPLANNIRKEQWEPVARALKNACKSEGLHADPSRTADAASILRPIGTTNNKHGKAVTVLKEGEITTYENMRRILGAVAAPVSDTSGLGAPPPHLAGAQYEHLIGYAPVSVEQVIGGCGALRAFSEIDGQIPEPAWRAALGILSGCEDGEHFAHEWSKRDPRYSRTQTQNKLDSWPAPVTCKEVGQHWDECKTCPFNGLIRNPLQVVSGEKEAVEYDDDTDEPIKHPMPAGYLRVQTPAGHVVIKKISTVEGEPPKTVYDRELYVEKFLRHSDGLSMLVVERHNGRERRAEVPTKDLTGRDWPKPMNAVAMDVTSSNMKDLRIYLEGWRSTEGYGIVPTINKRDHMGWQSDGFVVGTKLYKPGKVVEDVTLSEEAEKWAENIGTKGSLDVWTDTIDTLYNQPGMEHFQFTVLCGFASPLLNLMGDRGGILVYGHSDDGGHGKSTGGQAALSVWGHWRPRMMSVKSTTDLAFQSLLTSVCHMPVAYDEMTNYNAKYLSDLVHMINEGQPRARGTRTGSVNKRQGNWDMIVCASGNIRVSTKLQSIKGNSSAEMSRVFEYDFPKLKSKLSPSEASVLIDKLDNNYGLAGEKFIQYVLDHKAEIDQQLIAARNAFTKKYNYQGVDRYRTRLLASIFVGHKIATSLGLVKFAVAPVIKWMTSSITDQQEVVEETSQNSEGKFWSMLAELRSYTLVTVGDKNSLRRGAFYPEVRRESRGDIKAWTRISHEGDPGATPPNTYIFATAINEWCSKNSLSPQKMIKEWFDADLLTTDKPMQRRYGEGVADFSGKFAKMYEVKDPEAANAVISLTDRKPLAI